MLEEYVKVYDGPLYPTKQVLELACAAQRFNGEYLKNEEAVYDKDNQNILYFKISNKALIRYTIDPENQNLIGMEQYMTLLKITPEDIARAEEIKTYYKKLVFAAISGDNDFLTTVNSILNSEMVGLDKFGYVACLPSVQLKDQIHSKVKKVAKQVNETYLANPGSWLTDLDCEILESIKSKNFEGFNICAIIDNKMVGWISKNNLNIGPCVVVKAKVKDHSTHWKHGNAVTRLHYVKAAQ